MSRFVTSAPVRLTLANGDAITVRACLTHGEAQDLYRRSCRDIRPGDPEDERYQIDRVKATNELVNAYLIEWTFTDDDGALVDLRGLTADERLDLLKNLDRPSFSEIHALIVAHDAAILEAQKKTAAARASVSTLA